MQILQWLFKAAQEQESARERTASDQESKPKGTVLLKQRGSSKRARSGESGSRKFRVFAVLCRKDVAEACFYSTINLRRLGSIDRRQHRKFYNSRMSEEDSTQGIGIASQKTAEPLGSHVGSKVLPITESNMKAPSSSSSSSSSCDKPGKQEKEKEKVKGDKAKAMSRMKELLRWAAAAKTEKGVKFIGRKVLHFRARSVALKPVPDDDQLSIDSPKISFRWDVQSCSTVSSASAISMASASKIDQISGLLESAPRKGNWITTDSEFVVLEL